MNFLREKFPVHHLHIWTEGKAGKLTIKDIDSVSQRGEFYWVFKILGGFNADPNRVTDTAR